MLRSLEHQEELHFDLGQFLHDARAVTGGGTPLAPEKLPEGWTPLDLHPKQRERWEHRKRFAVNVAGRRSAKTVLALREAVISTLEWQGPRGRVLLLGPTISQARAIWWLRLQQLLPQELVTSKNEARMEIRLSNGNYFVVAGTESRKRLEGVPTIKVYADEFADVDPMVYGDTIRPMLLDTRGDFMALGRPRGRGHYYELYKQFEKDPEASVHSWKSLEVMECYLGKEEADREIAKLRESTDHWTFVSNYDAEFADVPNKAYYCFDPTAGESVRPWTYDRRRDLHLALDFNAAPGTGSMIQSEGEEDYVFDELYIKNDSNTERICAAFLEKYGAHEGEVILWGDPSGGFGGSAKVMGSDWDIVKRMLRPAFGSRLRSRVGHANPPVRGRLNVVNTRLRTESGKRRLFIDPRCKKTIDDFENCRRDPDGSLDKSDPWLTHLTDGIGYYIWERRHASLTGSLQR